jgi:adenylyltransferase/sulfurtransferase
MPQIGRRGQARLAQSDVAVIGAGGVKSPLLYYLAAAGVGRLRIIDHDHVELSNLNRQILYEVADIGRNKAAAAADRLGRLNPDITIEASGVRAGPGNLADLTDGADVVIEGGDSVTGRQLVSDHCTRIGVPMIHTSAQYAYGHLFTYLPGRSACFRCVFPDLPAGHGGPVPVLGCATGIAGSLAAMETLKLLVGHGQLHTDGFLTFTAFPGDFTFVPAPPRPGCGCAPA